VFLTGGGSRADIASLPILRFVAACTLAVAVLLVQRDDLARVRAPLWLLGALAVLMIAQLIPLPPELWLQLPGREAIRTLDTLIGLEVWRPITLSPMKTANALASLIVPAAALLLFAMCRDIEKILLGFLGLGVLSAIFGMLQLFADQSSGIYLYEVTNRGATVGLFANRNHHAVFLACCVMISLFLAMRRKASEAYGHSAALLGCAVVLSAAILISGSRAGLITLALVSLVYAAAVFLHPELLVSRRVRRLMPPRVLAAAAGSAGLILFGIFAFAGRIPALARIPGASDFAAELRTQVLPYLIDMTKDVQPFGVGFGAFEYAYRMVEPAHLLGPSYLNNAHFDWLQFLIEGGVPAGLILCVGAALATWRLYGLFKKDAGAPAAPIRTPLLGLGLLTILAVASLVDYPLRVPSVMALAVIALAMFAGPDMVAEAGSRSAHQRRTKQKP
jgi:hypothetical protein